MALSPAHKKFLTVDQSVGPAVFNFFLNAAIAWAIFRTHETVPLWGQQSIAGDTIATAFILPFLTGLIVTPLVGRQVKQGKFSALPLGTVPGAISILAGRTTFVRSLVIGAVGVVAFGLPAVGVWVVLGGPAELGLTPFIWTKAAFAGLLAAVLTPVISWAALVALPPGSQGGS